MTALVAVCSGVERKSLTTAAVCLADSRAHAVLRRRCCAQDKQVASNEDLPIPMENSYKEPLRRCILCEKRVDYKDVQVFVGRNKKK
ncbi:28S ribosomal protein S18c, mitochondrial-like isoform X3 [Microtus oregoni]|uniref:28S ribosomal protein S18c, mitochondrial-like isoform X3 n=1 Tax=Microtus oregoni TaxID=111838 RepID=UPI001BB1BCB7|nr:28S ribosomal protein S18c, mitochondrial-like isoform X3 [Microtus oregoni]